MSISRRFIGEGAAEKNLRFRFCGVHFFNPPRYMTLIEIIPVAATDPKLVEDLESFLTEPDESHPGPFRHPHLQAPSLMVKRAVFMGTTSSLRNRVGLASLHVPWEAEEDRPQR
jgi:3-hydroxyacyl-CoA dehydrogenase-like protein